MLSKFLYNSKKLSAPAAIDSATCSWHDHVQQMKRREGSPLDVALPLDGEMPLGGVVSGDRAQLRGVACDLVFRAANNILHQYGDWKR